MKAIALWFALLLMGAAQTTFSQTGLDPSFAQNGYFSYNGDCGMLIVRNNIVFDGATVTNLPRVSLFISLNQSGMVNTGFGNNGYVFRDTIQLLQGKRCNQLLSLFGKDFMMFVEFSNRAGELFHFDSLGRLNYSYGQGGVAYLPAISSAVLNTDSQDRVLYAGQRYGGGGPGLGGMSNFILYRYLPNGTIDSSFAINGRLEEATAQYAADVHSVEQTPDGKILLGEKEWMTSWSAYRYLNDGRTDSSFGGNGRVSIFWRKAFSFTRVQPDNKVLLIGYDADSVVVVRVNEDGSWDSSYGNNGIAKAAGGLVEHVVEQAAVRPDGRLVLGGNVDSSFAIWQLLPNGRVDTGFGQNGLITLKVRPQEKRDSRMTGLAHQQDGKIIICGNAQSGPPQSANDTTFMVAVVARFFANGRLAVQEPEFPESSVQLYPNPTGDVLKVAYPTLQETGSLIVCDITGRVMQNTPLSAGSSQTELRVHALTPGVYMLEVKTSSARLQKRFLKQ